MKEQGYPRRVEQVQLVNYLLEHSFLESLESSYELFYNIIVSFKNVILVNHNMLGQLITVFKNLSQPLRWPCLRRGRGRGKLLHIQLRLQSPERALPWKFTNS
jgi:hypothetical protein